MASSESTNARTFWLRILPSTFIGYRLKILADIDGCSIQDVAKMAILLYINQRLAEINQRLAEMKQQSDNNQLSEISERLAELKQQSDYN